ncbi:PHP domain-containing protein [Candidatus Bathyarchaeota archaeon]|nr:MAG: PHP domain-containing protein [Candidatus Bathyarchaeota archaeon]
MELLPLKIDFHVHTCYSGDCSTSLRDVISYSKKKGLDGVVITDHNTVEGALKLQKKSDNEIIIIPGIEVSTNAGHILGINVTTPIPRGLTIKETVEKIHEAGGIAVAAHPSAIYKSGVRLNKKIISQGIDAIEVINSSVFPFFLINSRSRKFACRAKMPQTGGSDSHIPETIGLAYTMISGVDVNSEIEEIICAVKRGWSIPRGRPVPWKIRLRQIFRK